MSLEPARKAVTPLLPLRAPARPDGYDVLPTHDVDGGRIGATVEDLARHLVTSRLVAIDGVPGSEPRVWARPLAAAAPDVTIVDVSAALRNPAELDEALAPYLGGDDPIFGRVCPWTVLDFFDARAVADLRDRVSDLLGDPTIAAVWVVGEGAAALFPDATSVFVEVPKNELQFRSRAGALVNLGPAHPLPPKQAYKRAFFVDWPIFERHKADLLPRLDWFVDGQRAIPTFVAGDRFRATWSRLTHGPVRARPWFEPGAWGGQWMKRRIEGLPLDPVNYAWSFELISPENGVVFAGQDGTLLEASWEWYMAAGSAAVLGSRGARFGRSFPIRFDFLDTVDGGNLSVQVHPRPAYAASHFGEPYTQDETYYILDADPDAVVYLGFHEGVTPTSFGDALRHARSTGETIDVTQYVQTFPARRHDLFLIPSGTVHCSGTGNLVLEISATPYIYTFKLYDWQRLDLDGRPRPLNVERGLENLVFERSGDTVRDTLVSEPRTVATHAGGRTVHLPTHPEHFFDVQRHEFRGTVHVDTCDSCHVLSVVQGDSIEVVTEDGQSRTVRYAETFVVPAAAASFRLVNEGTDEAYVVDAFLKPDRG